MKIRTQVRAGQDLSFAPPANDHCRTALWELYQNPTDGNKQRRFCGCCAADPYCLY